MTPDDFSGNKYHRQTVDLKGNPCTMDVYVVLRAFKVEAPGLQHAIKKLLCAGIRGKGDLSQDLSEAIDAVQAEITHLEHLEPPTS